MTPKTFDGIPLPPPDTVTASHRAVIEMIGLDQAGSSYEGRVYLNNPAADPQTERTPEQGFAGSFHVYGYGMPRPAGSEEGENDAELPMRRKVIATEAVIDAAKKDSVASVTIVPVLPGDAASRPPPQPGQVVVESVRVFAENIPAPS